MFASFLIALRRLSIYPLGESPEGLEGRESEVLALYPLAGLAVGAAPALVLVAAGLLGLQSPLAEMLAVAALAAVTGFRHLGELGRTVEGAISDRPALGALELMRDPRAGAAGAAAGTLVILAKFAALCALRVELAGSRSDLSGSTVGLVIAVLLAGCVGRWAAVMLACESEYARPEGGEEEGLISRTGGRESRWALAFTLAVVAVLIVVGFRNLGFLRIVAALAGATLLAWLVAVYCSRRFGGATGECMGAVTELAEVLALVLMSVLPAADRDFDPFPTGGPSRPEAVAPEKPVGSPGTEGNPDGGTRTGKRQ
ncbi:MAG: adenosylcobinamide-GDP ribazoletransferase [Planctomycetota bacterium]|jgi:adenosylcobinamide-GDP ribazoletransferase